MDHMSCDMYFNAQPTRLLLRLGYRIAEVRQIAILVVREQNGPVASALALAPICLAVNLIPSYQYLAKAGDHQFRTRRDWRRRQRVVYCRSSVPFVLPRPEPKA
jgi:hypothetical protein